MIWLLGVSGHSELGITTVLFDLPASPDPDELRAAFGLRPGAVVLAMAGEPPPSDRKSRDYTVADRAREAEKAERFTRHGEGRYRLIAPEAGVILDLDRLRRESGALVGELVVRSTIAGALTYDGILSAGDLNLSSVRARAERGKYLAARARLDGIDFVGILEEFSQRVIEMERAGEPAVLLRDIPRPGPDDEIGIDGLSLLRRHPVTMFGDGGALKSYIALYLAGRLDQMGIRVGLFDWELAGEDHRERLERLFGPEMPAVVYVRCTRPLVHEVDRLGRIVRDHGLAFGVYDSVAFACDGPPEAAEVAGRYFQAQRALGLGSLHIAHISKAEGSDLKPFGSAFWHNGSRATWFVKLAEDLPDSSRAAVALINRKRNLAAIQKAIGWEVTFTEDRTTFTRADPAANPDLAVGLSVRQRVYREVQAGALTVAELAERLDLKPDTIEKAVKRAGHVFTYVPVPGAGRTHLIGLPARGRDED